MKHVSPCYFHVINMHFMCRHKWSISLIINKNASIQITMRIKLGEIECINQIQTEIVVKINAAGHEKVQYSSSSISWGCKLRLDMWSPSEILLYMKQIKVWCWQRKSYRCLKFVMWVGVQVRKNCLITRGHWIQKLCKNRVSASETTNTRMDPGCGSNADVTAGATTGSANTKQSWMIGCLP